jgi:hypothetical protein
LYIDFLLKRFEIEPLVGLIPMMLLLPLPIMLNSLNSRPMHLPKHLRLLLTLLLLLLKLPMRLLRPSLLNYLLRAQRLPLGPMGPRGPRVL